MAAGYVTTGFSLPYVAKYAASGTTVTYSNGQKLARGVSATVTPTSTNTENNFYADNGLAESAPGGFNGATVSLEVDGLKKEAQALIYGLAAADQQGFINYDDNAVHPYVGVGFIYREQEDGVVSYTAIILPKVRFDYPTMSAQTQEQEIDWQTQTLSGTAFKSNEANGTWLKVGTAKVVDGTTYATAALAEAAAEAEIKTFLSIT